MYYNATLLVLILVLILLLIYWLWIFKFSPKKPELPNSSNSTDPSTSQNSDKPENSTDSSNSTKSEDHQPGLTTGQDYLPDEDKPTNGDTANPYYEKYKDIPRTVGCNDEFQRCGEWAANGECEANPDFMIQNCPNSCRSCNLSLEQKGVLVGYYLNETPKKCIYRGEAYPPGIRLSVAVSDLYH